MITIGNNKESTAFFSNNFREFKPTIVYEREPGAHLPDRRCYLLAYNCIGGNRTVGEKPCPDCLEMFLNTCHLLVRTLRRCCRCILMNIKELHSTKSILSPNSPAWNWLLKTSDDIPYWVS